MPLITSPPRPITPPILEAGNNKHVVASNPEDKDRFAKEALKRRPPVLLLPAPLLRRRLPPLEVVVVV
jgi:hypothetical protein